MPRRRAGRSPLARQLASLRRAGSLETLPGLLADRSTTLLAMGLAAVAAVPSPGVPVGAVFGTAIVWIALRALVGRAALPTFLTQQRIPPKMVDGALRRAVPLVRRVERLAAPAWPRLAQDTGRTIALIGIAVQGLLIALPIPFGNLPPALAIIALAGGLNRGDGLWVLAGHALSVLWLAALGLIGWGIWRITPA